MMDDNDSGARTGLWVVMGIITLLLFGLIGGLAIRATHAKKPSTAVAAKAMPAADAIATLDIPLSGDIVGKFFFDTASAALPTDAAAALDAVVKAAADSPGKKLVLAGFHDPSGDPAKNAELAKQRAKSVREALTGRGLELGRVLLRKPEQTALGGPADEARRVEVRMVEMP